MAGLQCVRQDEHVLYVLVDHLVPELSNADPFVGRLDKTQTLRAIQVIDRGARLFFEGGKNLRQQLVAERVLKPGKASYESIHPFRKVRIGRELPCAVRREWLIKKTTVGRREMGTFAAHHADEELQSKQTPSIDRHNLCPVFDASSWIGKRARFGAPISTSTRRSSSARDTRAASLAASNAGSSTGVGTSRKRSTSPPRAASSSREPKRRTLADGPASSAVNCRIAAA
ncbi:hypothetical protein ebA3903 [Aromatoleum aromaticum EbN1]|uniref:Uncharacterized protein n=1 Tax=Aromatoleum aromaticum (strain DSM 19018 / LMG 30748 / EbN1) TaxID=76114 RepID=Q5P2X3_AROAE|nr:hypothetical protein ebA3903 [Aromatoleum aromaticum EbN1]